jgi:hypothetical protein
MTWDKEGKQEIHLGKRVTLDIRQDHPQLTNSMPTSTEVALLAKKNWMWKK